MTFVDEFNAAFPAAAITNADISRVYWGIQPAPRHDEEMVQLSKQYEIRDHEREHGVRGLISVIGVKFTEARHVAEKIVNLVFEKLEKTPRPSLSASTPVVGGKIADIEGYVKGEIRNQSDRLSEQVIRSLITKYGTAYSRVLSCLDDILQDWPSLSPILAVSLAEVIYGVREEGAQKLSDAIFRRMTIDFTQPQPEESFLELCATSMSKEMGWDLQKRQNELKEVKGIFQSRVSTLS